MLPKIALAQNSRQKIGWLLLLVPAVLMTLNHIVLIFALDEPVLFTLAAAFNLYSLIVILIPLRQGEKWAWLTTWLLPVTFVLTAANDPNIAVFYISVSAVCVLGLLLTVGNFFSMDR